MNNVENNKDSNISVGASGHSRVTQKIEQKKDFSFIELLKSLKIIIPAIIILILLMAYFSGKFSLSDIEKFIPKF